MKIEQMKIMCIVYLVMCILDMDECRMIQCQNNATCQNLDGSYRCVCREGFEGKYCEKGNDIITFVEISSPFDKYM